LRLTVNVDKPGLWNKDSLKHADKNKYCRLIMWKNLKKTQNKNKQSKKSTFSTQLSLQSIWSSCAYGR